MKKIENEHELRSRFTVNKHRPPRGAMAGKVLNRLLKTKMLHTEGATYTTAKPPDGFF